MSYPHQDPYQQNNVHGGQPHVPVHNRTTSSSTSRSLQPPVQGVNNQLASRSLSGSRPPPGQAPTFDAYGAGQNREHPQAGVPFVPSTQSSQYVGPQGGQIHSPSFPEQTYQSVNQYNQPTAAGSHPHMASAHVRTHHSQPQQPLMPQNTAPAQYSQYQHDPSVRTPQQQWPSNSQYPQQQQQQQQQQPQQHPSSQRYPQQHQPLPTQPQTPYSAPSVNATASFRPNVPGELREMPGEMTRQSRSRHRDTTHAGPPCRFPNCPRPADRDEETRELTEYCSLDHMRDDLRRGVPPCPACGKCPKRLDGKYCGSSCEAWVRQRQQQPQQRQQQYHPSGVRPHSLAPSSANATWGSATGSAPSINPQGNIQHLGPGHPPVGGLVRCPKCGTTYSVRGRSRPRYETEPGDPIGHMSLPPCPSCGHSRRT